MKKSVIRFLGVVSLLCLQACGGGGDDGGTGGSVATGAGITESMPVKVAGEAAPTASEVAKASEAGGRGP